VEAVDPGAYLSATRFLLVRIAMLAVGCLAPVLLLIGGALLGAWLGGTAGSIWGSGIGLAMGLALAAVMVGGLLGARRKR